MSTLTKLQIVPGGRDLELKTTRLADTAIAACLGSNDPRAAVAGLAGDLFDEANAGTLAEALARAERLRKDAAIERLIKEVLGRLRRKATGLYAQTPARHDRETQLNWREGLTHWLFVLFRFGLLAVTIGLIAMYVRSSTYSPDLSTSWPMALAFGFPVLLLSYALSSIADGTDDLEAKRRIARRYTWLGSAVLLAWVMSSAMLFGFDTGGDTGFTVSFDAPAAAHGDWLSVLFPKTLAGKLLLLTHVVGDVLISAACGVWSKLAGLKGRRTGYDERADAAKLRELDDLQAGRLRALEVPVDHITGLEAQYPVGRRACINDAVTRLEAMQKEAAARQATALADTIRAFSVLR